MERDIEGERERKRERGKEKEEEKERDTHTLAQRHRKWAGRWGREEGRGLMACSCTRTSTHN